MQVVLSRMGRLMVGVALVVVVTVIAIIGRNSVGSADARSSTTSGVSSLSLVLLNSTDGQPHWGQNVTFNVSTSATSEPYVSLDCYQQGVLVYGASAGFFPSYPWPGSRIFPLSSQSWTGGAASCTATLYYVNGKRTITLKTLNFQVSA